MDHGIAIFSMQLHHIVKQQDHVLNKRTNDSIMRNHITLIRINNKRLSLKSKNIIFSVYIIN
jgi:hypothetical protein